MKTELGKPNYKKGQEVLISIGVAKIIKTPSPLWIRKIVKSITFGLIDNTKKHIYHVSI